MNIERRKIINAQLEKLQDIQDSVESLSSEEQKSYDNLPEALQNGETGERMQSAIEALSDAASYLGDAMGSLETAQE